MIDITVKEGWYIVTAPKCTPVLTRAQFIAAPKRGKWWKCRQGIPGTRGLRGRAPKRALQAQMPENVR